MSSLVAAVVTAIQNRPHFLPHSQKFVTGVYVGDSYPGSKFGANSFTEMACGYIGETFLQLYHLFRKHTHIDHRGVARIFCLGSRPCRAEPDRASTEVAKPMWGVWVLPQKNFADPNA